MRVIVKGIERDLTLEELYMEMEPFMKRLANKWNVEQTFEENMSVCKIAFMELTKKYDIRKGKAFITLLGIAIDGDFKNIIRGKNASKRTDGYEVSIYETIGKGRDEKELTLEDTLQDEESLYEYDRVERREIISQILMELTEEEREYVYQFLINRREQKSYAEEKGLRPGTLNKRYKRAIAKLQLIAANSMFNYA